MSGGGVLEVDIASISTRCRFVRFIYFLLDDLGRPHFVTLGRKAVSPVGIQLMRYPRKWCGLGVTDEEKPGLGFDAQRKGGP